MRARYYSPRSVERLAALKATDEDFEIIDAQVKMLARKPSLGYRVPFRHSADPLYRFDVGRFGLLYRFDKHELEVVTVVG